jgi:repressor LexA
MKHTLAKKEIELLIKLRNWFVHSGYSPSIRELQNELNYKSPRSITVLLERMKTKGLIERDGKGELRVIEGHKYDETKKTTIDIPLIGVVACGSPILAKENIIDKIPIDTKIARPPYKYFLLKAKGDSMNKKNINDGNLLLIRQQQTANNGDIVVALINEDATVKEFHRNGNYVVLKPHSTNVKHKPIFVAEDLMIQGIVVSVLPNV